MPKTVVLQQQNRQGTWISASFPVPNNISLVRVWGDVGQSDLNSAKSFRLAVESAPPNSDVWQPRYAFGWTGPSAEQPYLEVSVEAFRDQKIRAVLDVPETMRLGATVETV